MLGVVLWGFDRFSIFPAVLALPPFYLDLIPLRRRTHRLRGHYEVLPTKNLIFSQTPYWVFQRT